MTTRSQEFCLWGGVAFIVFFFLGWGVIAGFITPLATPRDSPEEVAAFFQEDTNLIRLGLVITIAVAPLQAFWAALISVHLKRIEGQTTMSYAQMLLGGAGVLFVILPMFIWEIAAFRPDRDPSETQLLNDIAWLAFIGAFSPAVFQSVAIGLAILQDPAERPVFPRWVGYFNFWVASLFIPGAVVFFAKSGPFAWNGIFPFWIPATVFGAWFAVMFVVLRRAISEQGQLATANV